MTTRLVLSVAIIPCCLLCCQMAGATTYGQHYGVCDRWWGQGGTGQLEVTMQNLGAKWIRDAFDWNEIEIADDVYDWMLLDSLVDAVAAIGGNSYLGIGYTPTWARPAGTMQNTPPTDPTKYTDFITVEVNRYKDRVKYWGFWNEPNLDGFYKHGDTAAGMNSYIQNLLIPGIRAVKAADPTAKTVVGELATFHDDIGVLQSMLQQCDAAGLHNMVDVVCTHGYGSNPVGHMDGVHNMLVSIGWGDKDFWCTESGRGSDGTNGEALQAAWVMDLMRGMDARPWWKKTFYYTMSELMHTADWTPKLGYSQYQAYIAEHADDAEVVSDTIPATMVAGRSYYVSVTMRNTGTTNWQGDAVFRLGAVGDSDPFSGTRQPLTPGETVLTDGTKTFWFTMTAPSTTGPYTTDWQMVHESVHWFGHALTKSVTVSNGPDTTAPGPVGAFTASPGDHKVTLSWQNPTDADYTGAMVRYKTSGYPTSLTDGTLVVDRLSNPGAADSYVAMGLINGVTYYFSAFAHDPLPNYAAKVDASAVPVDNEAPDHVSGFTAASGNNQNTLSWTNPTVSDFAATTVRFRTDTYPTGPTDGTLLCTRTGAPGSVGSFVHPSLTNGVTYYYSAYSFDEIPNYSTVANASAAPADVVPPAPATSLTTSDDEMQIGLSWTNPTDLDFAGIKILYKTTGYPSGPTDGTALYNGVGTNCIHTGIAGGMTYYYAAFAYDEVPNYSPAATRNVAHVSPYCYGDNFSYSNGSLNAILGWNGSATSQISVEDQTAKIGGGAGAYDASHSVTCGGGPLAVRARIKKGSGASTIWNMYMNDPSGGDLGKWYGSGTSSRGRIGTGTPTGIGTLTGGWDELYAKIDFSANTTQFVFNGVVLGTPTHTGGESIGSIKIERPDSSGATGQYVYLDDVTIGPADLTAPSATVGAPSAPVTKTGPVSFIVTFNEAVFGFSAASDVLVNSTGTAACTVSVTGTGPYTVTLSNITGGGTLGVTVKASACTDIAGIANTLSSASALVTVVASDGSLASAKHLANGSHVELCGKALYLDGAAYGYIEEQNRSAGMRIEGTVTANEGDIVCLSGTIQTTTGGEKYIQIGGIAPTGVGAVKTVGCTNRAVRSDLMDGLYVKIWGVVKAGSVTGGSYVLTDGSDDTGIKVITVGAPGVSDGQFVTVTGAAGIDDARVIHKK